MKAMEENMRRMILIGVCALILFLVTACSNHEKENISLETVGEEDLLETEGSTGTIFVYVCGAVREEGVYELPTGSRVYEAVQLAGGFRGDAATSAVNQAEVLTDEARLYVPTLAETLAEKSKDDGKVNINTATKEELMSLPGVGQSRAESIVQYREEVGAFQSIEDIMHVSGIKEGLFTKIKELIKI